MKTQKNVLMLGTSNRGFSLLELMVAILIIGLMATLVVPNLKELIPGHKQEAFFSELNNLVNLTWQNALTTQKMHRITFNFKDNVVQAEIEVPEKERSLTENYAPIVSNYSKSSVIMPGNLLAKEFFINGNDELKKMRGKTDKLWFFIPPEGMAQAIIVNMLNNDTGQQISLVLNPFTVQLKKYDTFQKP